MSEKKNISGGARKAQRLTRAEQGEERKIEETTPEEELGNNKVKNNSGAKRGGTNRRQPAKKTGGAKRGKIMSPDRRKHAAAKEERRAQTAKLREERRKARDERKAQTKAAKMEARTAKREAAAAERQAKREHRLKIRAEKRAEKRDKRRAPGFGGWLAAVISLGATCLVLATIVTYGWMNMSSMQAGAAGMQAQSLYELNSVVDNLDSNLAKARVASSAADRARVLTDIAIESEMAEVILERMPFETQTTAEIASFLNNMADSAQSMLYTVAAGGELTEWQLKTIEYMYANNLKLKRALNDIAGKAETCDMLEALRGGGLLQDGFNDISNNVIEEPKGIFDGPFADNKEDTNASFFEGMNEVNESAAESIAAEIFADYGVTEARCTGDARRGGMEFYNVTLKTRDGEMLAQLSKKGGKLIMFDSYKECSDHNFSAERCADIASDFLAAAGYENLEPVWISENGTTCNINFCYVQDGAVVYPDMIKVKVCEERGLVTGAEALSYVLNHSQRDIPAATITESQAKSAIDGRIDVTSSRLAVIPMDGKELLCYEFAGTFGGNEYFVYVDAQTGEEAQVLTVVGTAQGRAVI